MYVYRVLLPENKSVVNYHPTLFKKRIIFVWMFTLHMNWTSIVLSAKNCIMIQSNTLYIFNCRIQFSKDNWTQPFSNNVMHMTSRTPGFMTFSEVNFSRFQVAILMMSRPSLWNTYADDFLVREDFCDSGPPICTRSASILPRKLFCLGNERGRLYSRVGESQIP